MPYAQPKPIDLQFPVKGVDRSLTARMQPPLTTYELLNVRAFPPSSDRLGGGTREGLSKLFDEDNQAGAAGDRRITGLSTLTEATNIVDPNSYPPEAFSEDWSTQSAADPADLGNSWMPLTLQTSNITVNVGYSINGSQQLLMDSGTTGSATFILSRFFVQQGTPISVVVQADRQADGTADYGAAGQPHLVGPVMGVSNDGTSGIMACFVRTGADEITPKIFEYSQITFTEKVAGTAITLDGSGTTSDYTITLKRDDTTVTATFAATGVTSVGGDIDQEITYTTALTGLRGGLCTQPRSSASALQNARTIDSVSFTRLIPPDNTVYASADPADANPFDGNRYYLPSAFTGIQRSDAGVITTVAGGTTTGSTPLGPMIDDTDNEWEAQNPGQSNADFGDEINYAIYTDTTERFGLVARPKPGGVDQNNDMCSPVFRVSSDGLNALILHFYSNTNGATTGNSRIDRVYGIAVVNGVSTYLGSILGSNLIAQFRNTEGVRITDGGADDINIYDAGVLVAQITLSSFSNWTTEIGTALQAYSGVGFTSGVRLLTTSLLPGEFGKVEIVQGEVTSPIAFDNVKNKLAIFSPEALHVGDTAEGTVTAVSGPKLTSPVPTAASFNRKFYAVDGVDEIIINPATNTSSDWATAVTDGTLPSATRLVAAFRGSMYLAATDSDPTIWYKSRTLDPLDWDYGADPQVSTAVAGNNGEVGQPADAITALVPYSDDYLVFGMARSLGVLEGDPGYGGQFQIVSNEAGIVGPRSYCFDDRGNLYFVGAGGLYRMFRGQFDPEPVGPRKLRRELEEIDTSTHLIQMAFRPSDRTVRIYITPADGETVGTHIVYDTRTDGFFLDQIPLEFGPWSIEQTMGVADINRNIILGGNDGYIRRPDDSALSDDGTAIRAYVEIPVPEEFLGLSESICQELQFVMGAGGSGVQWAWFVGDSPEEVRQLTFDNAGYSDTGSFSGTGFADPIGIRATGAAHKLHLGATSAVNRWSLERAVALLSTTNLRRR